MHDSRKSILNGILADRTCREIFMLAAIQDNKSDVFITRLKLTRRQWYKRSYTLIKLGILERKNGRYILTSFGKIIHSAYLKFETKVDIALKYYYALMAIDSIDADSDSDKEHAKIIDKLIEDKDIKMIVGGIGKH